MLTLVAAALAFYAPPITIGTEADKFQPPKQTILGAEKPIPLGELVDLSLSPIEEKVAGLSQVSVSWRVFEGASPKRVRSSGDGVFFGAGVQPKKLLIVASVSYLFLAKEGDKITDAQVRNVLLTTELQIGQPEPEPTPGPRPGPGPSPNPTPVLPDGRFGLAKISYSLANAKVLSGRTKGAAALASTFDSLASAIAAGAYKTADSILKATKEANNSSLTESGVDITLWDDFGTEIQSVLYQMSKEKKLVSTDDYSDAWKEIALGLRAVK
jgi:hypothetical protein